MAEVRSARFDSLAPRALSSEKLSGWMRFIAIPVAASALLALCAHISLPRALTPVPTTMQTFAVLLIGILLGPVGGATTMLLYLAEGAVGLPVFSPQGLGGLAQLSGPTAGYLLAYPVAAYICGAVFRKLSQLLPIVAAALLTGLVAELPIFLCGGTWLLTFLHLTPSAALQAGVLPFLPAEAIKLVLVATATVALSQQRRPG